MPYSRTVVRRRRVALGLVLAALAMALWWVLPTGRSDLADAEPDRGANAPTTTGAATTTAAPTSRTTQASPPTSATPVPPPTAKGAPITIAFGGDIHFAGSSARALSQGLGPISDVLSSADLAVANLETAVTTRGDAAPKEYNFRAPPAAMDTLKRAGIDVASMANNHGMDYGVEGLQDSLAAAKTAGFPLVGIGQDDAQAFAPWVTEVKGQRVAVIGATQVLDTSLAAAWTAGPGKPGLASAKDEPRLVEAVRLARSTADTVVVYLHWGQEQVSCPLDRQRDLAQRLADAGADVIVGSHAHVLLGGGYLANAYVHYGLGNFVFYATRPSGVESGVLTLTVAGRAVTDAKWTPARISGGIPTPLPASQAKSATASWERLRACTGLAKSPTPAG